MADVKDLSVEEKLKNLYELQTIYSKIDEIQVLKGELPIEVSDLEDELAGLETRITKLQDEMKEYESNISKYRNQIKDSEALIQKYEKQQSNVKNNREFDALSKEIELQRLDIQLSEKKIREANEGITAKKDYLEESGKLIEKKKEDLNIKKGELERIISETVKEEQELTKKANKAAEGIEDRLVIAFNKIRRTYLNGLAVVKFERDSCGGCFAKIPPQRQLEIRQRKKIIICEHCGRVLVDPEIDTTDNEPEA